MLRRSVIIAGVLAIGFVLGLGTQAFTQDKKPAEKKPPTTRAGLYRIHAAVETDFQFARDAAAQDSRAS